MTFRIKIVTPIQVDAADLERRRERYGERAAASTEIEVIGLGSGPFALESRADLDASEAAVFAAAAPLGRQDCDAVLIDCIFDPAVDALARHLPVPVFGPLRTALAAAALIAPSFGMVARAEEHVAVFTELITRYGHRERLSGIRTLGLPYQEARRPERFAAAMQSELRAVVEDDGARAVILGSTTMALTPEVAAAGQGVPLLLSGMMTFGIMESLWRDGLLVPR